MNPWMAIAMAAIAGVTIGGAGGGLLVASETIWTSEQVQGLTVGEAYVLGMVAGECQARTELTNETWEACYENATATYGLEEPWN